MRRPFVVAAVVAAFLAGSAVATVAQQSQPSQSDAMAALDQVKAYVEAHPDTTSIPATTVPEMTTVPETTTTTEEPSTTTSTSPSTTTSSTSTPSTTTTSTAPTTTEPSTTTTTTAPPPPRGCTFRTATADVTPVAFCDTFNAAAGNPATRTGDLNPVIWGVSRTNTFVNPGQGQFNDWPTATPGPCGTTAAPPNDVRICGGRLVDSVSDHGGQPTLAMYPKQPFDIAGRTGTAVFDVSADSAGPHAAWPEFWWTDQPVPAPHADLPSQFPYARNSFGFSLASDQCPVGQTSVYQFFTTMNYDPVTFAANPDGCVRKGTATSLNHFEVRVSANRVGVWGSDPGASTVRLLAHFDGALPLSRGVIWIEDVHYNACKDGASIQCNHTFTWDNVGFDGPRPYTDLTFDVADANTPAKEGRNLGYEVKAGGSRTVATAVPVSWQQTPTGAYVGFNWWPEQGTVPSVSVNGGPTHTIPWPGNDTFGWRTAAIPVNLSEVHTGINTVTFRWTGSTSTVVSNINVILIAAAP